MSIGDIENALDLNDDEIRSMYNSWDKGDCSKVGLLKILLLQEIKLRNKQEHPYVGDMDELMESIRNSGS